MYKINQSFITTVAALYKLPTRQAVKSDRKVTDLMGIHNELKEQ